jgi:N6-L-threonylcarbamoyladenine synthase
VIDALVRKTRAALRQGEGRYRSLGLSGGVANNQRLREGLGRDAQRVRIPFLAAQPRHTGDNAGMIAFAAWADTTGTDRSSGLKLQIEPGMGPTPTTGAGAYL